MIARARLIVALARPAVVVLLAMFAATGLAQAGQAGMTLVAATVMTAIAGFLLFSVACNDLADEAIDRVNLPGSRPLAAGLISRRDLAVAGGCAAAVALAASFLLGWPAALVTVAGLAVSAGYSLRPVRIADRGAVASLVLPACYVAVPYLLGVLGAHGDARDMIRPGTLLLLAGLYLGFIGRILLKDFRDVRGDALFGKRTFLVRHGRARTCLFSACAWAAGTCLILAATRGLTLSLLGAEAACTVTALALLRALSADRGPRRDEALIAAIAITGRGMILLLLAHLSMTDAQWAPWRYDAVLAALAVLTAGPAWSMMRHGPASRRTLPVGDNQSEPLPGRTHHQPTRNDRPGAVAYGERLGDSTRTASPVGWAGFR